MATDLTQYADRTGRMTVDTLSFAVRVIEARNRYGHLDFRVTPIAGGGERWVEQHRVDLDPVLLTDTVAISDSLVHEMKTPMTTYSLKADLH
jgi:hypothetical protein